MVSYFEVFEIFKGYYLEVDDLVLNVTIPVRAPVRCITKVMNVSFVLNFILRIWFLYDTLMFS